MTGPREQADTGGRVDVCDYTSWKAKGVDIGIKSAHGGLWIDAGDNRGQSRAEHAIMNGVVSRGLGVFRRKKALEVCFDREELEEITDIFTINRFQIEEISGGDWFVSIATTHAAAVSASSSSKHLALRTIELVSTSSEVMQGGRDGQVEGQ